MPPTPDFLDPLSEMIALSTWGNTKNLIITAVALEGPLNADAAAEAVGRAVEHFPRLRSCLREVKGAFRRRLAWEVRHDREFPIHMSSLSGRNPSYPTFNEFLDHLAPRLERDWDLFHKLPGEFYLVKVKPDFSIAGSVLHHAASDAVMATDFGRRILLEYHELVTGKKHEALEDTLVLSVSKKKRVRRRKSTWADMAQNVLKSMVPYRQRPALPIGSGPTKDRGQHHIKKTLSLEESQRLLRASLENGVSFVDLLAACADIAVDKWNEARNAPPGMLTNSMTINMKGRYSGLDNPNAGGILFFKSLPEERTDTVSFAKTLSADRVKQLRKQLDFTYYANVTRLANSFRVLPFTTRRRFFHYFLQKHHVSLGLTFMGVVWPKMKNGKPTTETGLTEVGGLEITEMHGVGYKLLSSTPLLIIVYLFRNRMNFVLAASGSLFTWEESEAFLDLVTQLLLDT